MDCGLWIWHNTGYVAWCGVGAIIDGGGTAIGDLEAGQEAGGGDDETTTETTGGDLGTTGEGGAERSTMGEEEARPGGGADPPPGPARRTTVIRANARATSRTSCTVLKCTLALF